jgi:8-oxo-dGTP diphosphatase
MIIKDKPIDQISVGCILLYKGKFLIFERKKENVWGSVAGKLEDHENIQECIEREILEELGIKIKPEYFTTIQHFAYGKNIEYHMFEYEINDKEFNSIELDKREHGGQILVSLEDSKKLNLFEDEHYCLSEYLRRKKLKKIRRVSCMLKYKDKFLVIRRNVSCSQGGKWGLPGGKQKEGEKDLETLKRELKEELNYNIKEGIKKIGEWTWHLDRVVEFPLYEIKLKEKIDVKLDDEHNDYKWVTEDEFFNMENHVEGTRALILLIRNPCHKI